MTRRRWTRVDSLPHGKRERQKERARESRRKRVEKEKEEKREKGDEGREKKQYGGKESPGKREPVVVRGNPCVLPEKVHEPPRQK